MNSDWIDEAIKFLTYWKLNSKSVWSSEQRKAFHRAIIFISNNSHNFPHYDTCDTCLDGWDMEIDFLIKRLKRLKAGKRTTTKDKVSKW